MNMGYDEFRQNQLKHRPDIEKFLDKTNSISLRIAKALKNIRRNTGLSQRDLAEITGWKQSYIARIETLSEDNLPSLETIVRYADACGLEVGLNFYEKTSNNTFNLKQAVAITNDAQLLQYVENLANESERL